MTGNTKRIIFLLSGICAALAAFSAIELLYSAKFTGYLLLSLLQGAVLGLIFGFTFGFADAIAYKELKSGLFRALPAALIGAAAAGAAQIFTSQAMLWTANLLKLEYDNTINILLPLWRGIGWMLMGMAIGAVDGIHKRSGRRILAGILGGAAGGLIGGLAFEFLLRNLPEIWTGRAAGLLLMGILIGLFLGEFERRFSYARLRVLNGRLKDREFLLVKAKTEISGNLNSDIYLKGYSEIPAAVLTRTDGEIYFATRHDNSDDSGDGFTLLNDKPAAEKAALKYFDVIQLGSVKLLYLPL